MHCHPLTYEHASGEAHRVSAEREAQREAMTRVSPADAIRPRFTYKFVRDPFAQFIPQWLKYWTDNETGATAFFSAEDYAGAARWRIEQERRS